MELASVEDLVLSSPFIPLQRGKSNLIFEPDFTRFSHALQKEKSSERVSVRASIEIQKEKSELLP